MACVDSCDPIGHSDCDPSEDTPENGTTSCSDNTVVLPEDSARLSVPLLSEGFEGPHQFFSDMLASLLREEPSLVVPACAEGAGSMPAVRDRLHVSRPIRGPSA